MLVLYIIPFNVFIAPVWLPDDKIRYRVFKCSFKMYNTWYYCYCRALRAEILFMHVPCYSDFLEIKSLSPPLKAVRFP